MSKKATEFQKREMSKMYRGKEIFKPLNTGWVDERVACVREWVANIFFYRKGDTTIMIDAGYNYDRLEEKMGWLGIDPTSIRHILITHQDTDHVGAVEADSPGLFRSAKLYIGEIENRYLTGEVRRKVIYRLYKLPQVTINNEKVLLHDGETFEIDGIKIECFLVPGHTWGHMVYLIDDKYLFTGDTLWFGADGGYSFISSLAESNKLAVKSLAALEQKLQSRGLLVRAMADAFQGGVLVFDAANEKAVKLMLKTWLKDAEIKDVGAYFAVSDAKSEIGAWDSSLRVSSRGYMLGYNDLKGPSVSGFFRFLARVGDGMMNMQIVKIKFRGKQ